MSKKKDIVIPDVKNLYSCNVLICPIHINQDDIESVVKEALALHMVNSQEPVSLIINSYGGSLPAAFQLIDVLLGMRRPVVTYCLGHACSAGLSIFLAGDIRIATKHSYFLAHQYTWGNYDKYHELKAGRAIEDWLHKMLYDYIKERASKEAADLEAGKSDAWLTPQQAKRVGIVHKIVNRVNIPRVVGKPLKLED